MTMAYQFGDDASPWTNHLSVLSVRPPHRSRVWHVAVVATSDYAR